MEQNNIAPIENTLPDGFFYASEEEKEYGVLSWVLDDGSIIRQVILPHSKKTAVVRKYDKLGLQRAGRLVNEASKGVICLVADHVELDGKPPLIDEIERLSLRDYTVLVYAMERATYQTI